MERDYFKGMFILIAVIAVISIGLQVFQFGHAMQSGDQAYQIQVYNPADRNYDVYYANELKNVEGGFIEFKDAFGIVHRESSYSIKITKLK